MSRLLSRKQLWMRQRGYRSDSHESRDFLYREGLGVEAPSTLRTAVSDQIINRSEDMAPIYSGKPYFSTDDLKNSFRPSNTREQKKSLKFNTAVHVVLIPTRYDYKNVGLGNVMWWADEDYNQFKSEATSELKLYMSSYSEFNCKKAIEVLYQPNDVDILSDLVITLQSKEAQKLAMLKKLQIIDDMSNLIEDPTFDDTSKSKNNNALKSGEVDAIESPRSISDRASTFEKKNNNNNSNNNNNRNENNNHKNIPKCIDVKNDVSNNNLKDTTKESPSTTPIVIPHNVKLKADCQARSFTDDFNSLALQRSESKSKISSPFRQRSLDDMDIMARATFLQLKTDVDLIMSTFQHKGWLNTKASGGFKQLLVAT